MNVVSLIIQIIGLSVAAAIVWIVGPIVEVQDAYPLESEINRGVLIGALVLVWLAWVIWQRIVAKKKNDELLAEMGSQGQEIDEETGIIDQRFREALAVLKNSKQGGNKKTYLYDIPWYVIIGPPGSGKTTALLNSGLTFPLEEKFGAEAMKGIGGTRHCDWWFTNEAVLIDTAGRFTSQDSHKAVDQAGWDKFIQLLKRYRKERPINGAMVTMSLSDLMRQTPEQRLGSARTIRQRIDELSEGLGITFPVYFMFTKADMVAGFNEFFGHYGALERDQVWGDTFGLNAKGECTFDIAQYGERFDRLIARLEAQVLDRVHEERDRDNRAAMIGFPVQMLSLKTILCEFVNECFAPNRYSRQPLLRGVYYTSGTQEGTPIDQLLGSLAQDFGIDASRAITYSGQGRSFFLGRLLKDVIFGESLIAGADSSIARRKRLVRMGGYGVVASLIAASVGAWTLSYEANRNEISRIEDAIKGEASDAGATGVVSLEQAAAKLDSLRSAAMHEEETFPSMGLLQSATVRNAARSAYLLSLENTLLPLIVARVEDRLMDAVTRRNTGEVYQMLKAYLTYAGLHESAGVSIEDEFLFGLNRDDWAQQLVGQEGLVESLDVHQRELLGGGFSYVTASDGLVKQARQVLLSSPLAEQIYQSIKQTLLQNRSQDLRFAQIAGPAGLDFFASNAGRSLPDYAMPGMFTRAGYAALMLPQIDLQAKEYVENNWVLGEHNKQDASVMLADLRTQVVEIYKGDYIEHWESLLADLRLRNPGDLDERVALLEAGARFNGPVESLFNTLVEQTRLADIERQVAQVAGLGNSGIVVEANDKVGNHFAEYARLTSTGTGGSVLDRLLQETRTITVFVRETLMSDYRDTPALATIGRRTQGDSRDLFGALRSQVPFLPDVAKRLMTEVQDNAWSIVMTKAKAELDKVWEEEIHRFYRDRLATRYPLAPKAVTEAQVADFVEFFSSGGLLSRFIAQYLAPVVHTDADSWAERQIDQRRLGLNASALGAVRKLNRISQVYFPSANSSAIAMTLTPVRLSDGVGKFVVASGEAQGQVTRDSGQLVNLEWPMRSQAQRSWYQFYDADNNAKAPVTMDGPWSVFRLLGSGETKKLGRNSYEVKFVQEGLSATFELRISGAGDLLDADLFQDLVVPRGL